MLAAHIHELRALRLAYTPTVAALAAELQCSAAGRPSADYPLRADPRFLAEAHALLPRRAEQAAAAARANAARLAREHKELYGLLAGRRIRAIERERYFALHDIDVSGKRRKQQLIERLFERPEWAPASAELVLRLTG